MNRCEFDNLCKSFNQEQKDRAREVWVSLISFDEAISHDQQYCDPLGVLIACEEAEQAISTFDGCDDFNLLVSAVRKETGRYRNGALETAMQMIEVIDCLSKEIALSQGQRQ